MRWAVVVGLLTVAALPAGCGHPLAAPDAAAPSLPSPARADGGSAPAPVATSDAGAAPVTPPTRPPQTGLCDPSGWCWQNPLPQGQDVVAIWGASSDDVWASTGYVGGRLLRRTPAGWAFVDTAGFSATAIWGASSDDVWAVGYRPASGGSSIAAIAHWDGSAWIPAWSPPAALSDIAGSASNDVWAIGDGLVVHWDGAAWTSVPPPPADPIRGLHLASVWPAGPNDVWVGGYDHLWHWDGALWTDYPFSRSWFADLWGSASNDVWAVDGTPERTLLHWNGQVWAQQTLGLPAGSLSELYRVSGTGPRDVWLTGNAGSVYSFDGVSWHDWSGLAPGVQYTYAQALWAGPSVVLASFHDGGVSGFDGRAWRAEMPGYVGVMRSVSGAAPDDVWFASGSSPLSLLHWQGTALEELPLPAAEISGTKSCIYDVWATGGGEVWFAGCGGLLGRRTPAGWTFFDATSANLHSVWASGPDDAWTVGDAGTALHWDGGGWSPVDVPTASQTTWLTQVRGSGRDDVWILAGLLEHWDGQSWTGAARGGDNIWVNAPDDVWTTWGSSSTMGATVGVSHFDGATWSDWFFEMDALPTVWSPGRGEAWVSAGWGLHYHDGAWEYPNLPIDTGGFWGSSADDVWAIGFLNSAILRRNAR